MSRLSKTLLENRNAGVKSLGIFLTSGFPTPDDTPDLLHAICEGGADFVELGMPFSDPLAEGLPIQRSSEKALSAGITMERTLASARAFRNAHDAPLVLMGYANPVWRYGIGNFFDAAGSCGVDAVILPDLPPEESEAFRLAADEHGVDLVFLIAPNSSDERVRRIDALSSGFVYAVSITGLTGTRVRNMEAISDYLYRIRGLSLQNPVLVGFGISNAADFAELSRHADGCIVGSALIRAVEALWNEPDLSASQRFEAVSSFVRGLRSAESGP